MLDDVSSWQLRTVPCDQRVSSTETVVYLHCCNQDNMRVQRLILKDVGLDKDGVESLARGLVDNVTLSFLVTSRVVHGNVTLTTVETSH